jgi:hypothetical chaperone protein
MPVWIINLLTKWHSIPFLRDKKIRVFLSEIKMTADDRGAIENLISLIEDNYGFLLFRAIEKAKIKLSDKEEGRIRFRERNLAIDEKITRKEFEGMISDKINLIRKCIDNTLLLAGLTESKIDTVFLTGGSSLIPMIRRIFINKFGKEKIVQMDAFTSVAKGLGISSSLFS